MQLDAKIFVAGHRGLVGSAITRRLGTLGYSSILTRSHAELDLLRQADVEAFFERERPRFVFLAAARVGGILANSTYPVEFMESNLGIELNVIRAAHQFGVERLIFLGSTCVYPRDCPQPIKEEYLLSGPLEATNAPYAIAKIAGIALCRAYNRQYGAQFLSLMPTNLYGPGDNYDLDNAHVLPAMIRKIVAAKQAGGGEVVIWGTGKPLREFLYVEDLADAAVFLANLPQDAYAALLNNTGAPALINVGSSQEVSIAELATLIAEVAGYRGRFVYDASKPDGTPRKLSDCTRLNATGWRAPTDLRSGLHKTIQAYETSAHHRGE